MKVETTDTKQFKPFELVITIESKEELDALIHMCAFNKSIPELASPKYRDLVRLFLDGTRDALGKKNIMTSFKEKI
jgi:hypothetical protein